MEGGTSRGGFRSFAKTFLYCSVLFILSMIPILTVTGGRYVYSGDYNGQIVSFWEHIHNTLKSGITLFDWSSDIGMDFVSGYSFYGLASPYTLLSLVFPASLLPYGITLLNAFKFGIAGAAAHLYCSRYTEKESSARICGMLYAFSGIMLFDLVFHFSDTISLFPLVLWSLDRLMYENRKGLFALFLGISAASNYYLFFGICVFLVMYFVIKVLSHEYALNGKKLISAAAEAVAGTALAAVILLPSFLMILDSPRANNTISLINSVVYENKEVWLKLPESMLFLPERCVYSFFADSREINISSLSLFIPLFTVVGVISEWRNRRHSWHNRLLTVCLIFSAVPILNSSFSAFNGNYYARWFFMPLLIMIMMTGRYLDRFETADIKYELIGVGAATAAFSAYGIYRIFKLSEGAKELGSRALPTASCVFILGFSAISVLLLYVIRYHKNDILNARRLPLITAAVCVIPFYFYSANHPDITSVYTERAYESIYNSGTELSIDDEGFFRTTCSGSDMGNYPIAWDYPVVGLFSSTVPRSISEFYSYIAQPRYSNSLQNILQDEYAVNSFLSVKYDLICNHKLAGGVEVDPKDVEQPRYGYTLKDSSGSYLIYQNENYIPMGFTYDHYLPLEEFDPVEFRSGEEAMDTEEAYRREKLLLKAIWLTDEQIEKYGGMLTLLPEDEKKDTSEAAYVSDCERRRESAAVSFETDGRGFTSKVSLDRENLVFYSVPYSEGFTACVDGEPAEIECVFGGLCAVDVPEGVHTVRFDYFPKGLAAGIGISCGAAVILAVYLIICRKKQGKAAE
ncbi:MAG: YfhO family protein [Ruminococcus sp.]|nr:YfhO family protein [Ruminococcus sp.]